MPFDYSTVDLQSILARAHANMDDLQRPGVGKARAYKRVLFNCWMGVGKTFMSWTSAFLVQPQIIVVVCPTKRAFATWQDQLAQWFPEFSDPKLQQVIKGQAHQRQKQWANPKALVFFTTKGSLEHDWAFLKAHKFRVDALIMDEIRKMGLRNRKSVGHKLVKDIIASVEKYHHIKMVIFAEGTVSNKHTERFYGVLHLLASQQFRSYWDYVNRYVHTVKGMWGVEILGPKNLEEWADVTSPYVYTVDEKTASKHLPEMRRIMLPVDMDEEVETLYRTMLDELYFEFQDRVEVGTTILAAYTKLRQLMTTPKIFDPNLPIGAALEVVVDKILEVDPDTTKNWKHNLIFTPFLDAIPHYQQYICDRLKMVPDDIIIIKGGMDQDEMRRKENLFRANLETTIIASIGSSDNWNAETALNCYFPHFDWDPDANKQAEARSRRKSGIQQFIGSYYVNYRGTITEDMFSMLNHKESGTNKVNNAIALFKARMEAQRASHTRI